MKKRMFILSALGSLLALWFIATVALATHERVLSATPFHVPLVPAFKDCSGAGNSTHGTPLAFPSCNPPVAVSTTVRNGNPSGTPGSATGYAQLVVCATGAAPAVCKEAAPGFTTALQPDVRIWGQGRDLQCKIVGTPALCVASSGPSSDYNPNAATGPYTTICTTAANCGNSSFKPSPFCAPGAGSSAACMAGHDITATAALAQPSTTTVDPSTFCNPTDVTCLTFATTFVGHAIRVTDHYNCDPALPPSSTDPNKCPASQTSSSRPATMIDILFPVPVDCIPNPEASINGSNCGVNTTANALVPQSVIAGKQAVVEVGEVQLLDAGPDGVAGQGNDDQRFAVQGLYLP